MMLKLQKPSKALQEEYAQKLLPTLIKRIKNGASFHETHHVLSNAAKKVLLPDCDVTRPQNTNRLKELLTKEPAELLVLERKIMNEMNQIANRTERPTDEQLKAIIGYENVFNSSSKSIAFWLAKKVGRNTCVYCNRQYVFTVEKGDGNVANERITRPVFDHWFPKASHPLLSLSLFNLIPSCSICNSSVKGCADFSLETHIHPYVHENNHPQFTFKVTAAPKTELIWGVRLEAEPGSKEEKTIKDLCLNEIYTMHGALEVNDLMEFKQKYPAGYLKQLMQDVLDKVGEGHNITLEDVYRMIFGVELKKEKFLDRPLSKMKYDILHDMGVI